MRLAEQEDVDIALDELGQPVVEAGNICTVSGYDCCKQDIYLEVLTEEGELVHEDEEGRWAYGFGLKEMLNEESGDNLNEEVSARVHEKLTKRDYVDADSIKVVMKDTPNRREKNLEIKFSWVDETAESEIDLTIDGMEVNAG